MSDLATTTDPASAYPRIRTRIGFDFNTAGRRFTTYVKQLASERARDTGGLRAVDVTLGARPPGPIPERKVTFYFVELEGTMLEIAQTLRSMIPLEQVAPNQFGIEVREPDHLHVLATGITTWLVCRGEALPPVVTLPPLTPTPSTGDTGGGGEEPSNVVQVEFRRAA